MEFALSLPVVILLVLGAADAGRAYYYREAVANATREALREAVSSNEQATGNTVCNASGGTVSSTLPAPNGSTIATIVNLAAQESSTNGSSSGSAISGSTVTVTWHCNGAVAVTNSTNAGVTDPASAQSDAIEVRISYHMSFITPVLTQIVGSSGATMTVDLVGRAEY